MQILPPIPIGPSQFACPYCPVIMKTSKDTRRHILIHSGIKPYRCQFCPYSGTQKVHLKSHIANKHKDCVGIWFLIFVMNSSFSSESFELQNRPNPIHLGPKQFGCTYCTVVMKTSKNVRRHILMHSGIKPFSCQYCQYSANRKDNLKSHLANMHKDNVEIWSVIGIDF